MQNLKENKKFLRQCINCRKYKSKSELIRITKESKTEEIYINQNSNIYGHSVYICKNIDCIKNTIKKKKIENILKSNLSENIKEKLYENVKE